MDRIEQIFLKEILEKEDLVHLLSTHDDIERMKIFKKAAAIREEHVGNQVYLRGLIELSNICRKNCLYCGIRKDNKTITRYSLNDSEVLDIAQHAWQSGYGSLVIQSGERTDKAFRTRITNLIRQIKILSKDKLGITLSCGEQEADTYREWYEWGVHRYLLRVESSNEELYQRLHPADGSHSYSRRLNALETLKKIGYQTGTGVMIGVPGQKAEHLADDLLFFKDFDIDMVGMGPYIPHKDTPLYQANSEYPSPTERFELSQRMIALLRILMKDINIAAATALDVLYPSGRAIALISGANVFMPNLTPQENAKNYSLYHNKPVATDQADCSVVEMTEKIRPYNLKIVYEEWGDAPHYGRRILNN